jgi:hypothetical protein
VITLLKGPNLGVGAALIIYNLVVVLPGGYCSHAILDPPFSTAMQVTVRRRLPL